MNRLCCLLLLSAAVLTGCFPPPPCNDEFVAISAGTYRAAEGERAPEEDWKLEVPSDRDGGVVVETFTRNGKTYRVTYRSSGAVWVSDFSLPSE